MKGIEQKTVFVCEDHRIIVDGLQLLFENSDYQLIGHTQDGRKLLDELKRLKPRILILDLNLSGIDGLELLSQIRKTKIELHVVILTMYQNEILVNQAKNLGAQAFLLKNASNSELLNALGQLDDNTFYVSKAITKDQQKKKEYLDGFVRKMKLTKREIELIKHFVSGRSASEIAESLNLSVFTVETHKKNIFKKLKIRNTVELVNFSHENNLL